VSGSGERQGTVSGGTVRRLPDPGRADSAPGRTESAAQGRRTYGTGTLHSYGTGEPCSVGGVQADSGARDASGAVLSSAVYGVSRAVYGGRRRRVACPVVRGRGMRTRAALLQLT
jgi:hypothetical protein